MLKFTYSETGISLEHVSQSIEHLITRRAVLAVRTQSRFILEPCSASFLLPNDLDQLPSLERLVNQEATVNAIALAIADAEYIEVSVQGLWICSDMETIEGLFVLSLAPELEMLLFELWQISHFCVPVALR